MFTMGYGQFDDLPFFNMLIFHSYVNVQQGISHSITISDHFQSHKNPIQTPFLLINKSPKNGGTHS